MTDRDLAQRVVRHGDHKAFAGIVRRHSAAVFSKAVGILHDEDAAAEVTQQVFVRAYEGLDTWRGDNLAPWLIAIAAHTALKHLEKIRRRRTVSLDTLPDDSPRDFARLSDEDDYSDERESRLQRMEAAIAALPEADRALLGLHYYEQLSTADIARRTGLTQSNVLVRLHRIRERLKTHLSHE